MFSSFLIIIIPKAASDAQTMKARMQTIAQII